MNIRCVIAISLMVAGCSRDPSYEKVFQHPMNEWEDRAAKLSDQDLVDAYVYGLNDRRPPVVLATPVAARGVPLFETVARLSIEQKDDYMLSSLMQIATRIESKRAGSICGSRQAMALLAQAGAKLDTVVIKQSFRKDLAGLCVKVSE